MRKRAQKSNQKPNNLISGLHNIKKNVMCNMVVEYCNEIQRNTGLWTIVNSHHIVATNFLRLIL